MVIAIPFGILTAAFLSEVAPKRMQMITKPVIEMLVAIPFVAIGFSGIVLLGTEISRLFGIQNRLNTLPYHLYMISTQHSAIEEVRSLAYLAQRSICSKCQISHLPKIKALILIG